MTKHVFALIVVFAATSTSLAAEPAAGSDDIAALIDLEHSWVHALEKADARTLASIFVDTYIDTDETGHRADKNAVLAALKSGALKIKAIQLSDMKAVLYGSAAVVTGSSSQEGTYEGHPLARQIVFTDTFVRNGKDWKAVASQRTVVTE